MRKPRGDSKLWSQPDEVRKRIWLKLSEVTYAEARAWCAEELGVETSESALSDFYAKYAREEMIRRAHSDAEDLKAFIERRPDIDPGMAREVAELVFDLQAAKADSPAEYIALERLRLDKKTAELRHKQEMEKLEVSKRRVAVAEKRLEAVRATVDEVHEEGGLTEEQLKKFEKAMGLS